MICAYYDKKVFIKKANGKTTVSLTWYYFGKKVNVSFCHVQNMSLLCTNFEINNESTGNQK